ncbi:uncharacterized protein METZ01_LOCUS341505, partial [marine metagenome]
MNRELSLLGLLPYPSGTIYLQTDASFLKSTEDKVPSAISLQTLAK